MPERPTPLPLLRGPADEVAPRILGWILTRTLADGSVLKGRIIEVEAYVGTADAACHAFNGRRTPRNESMYAPPGTLYVYFTYGMHFCMNVVCAAAGDPHAVLIRALEPLEGLDHMRAHRLAGRAAGTKQSLRAHELCRGPANLCKALAIDRALDRAKLLAPGPLRLQPGQLTPSEQRQVRRTPRIGIGATGPWVVRRLRWVIAGHPAASGPRVMKPLPR